jgi:hypothetical protein
MRLLGMPLPALVLASACVPSLEGLATEPAEVPGAPLPEAGTDDAVADDDGRGGDEPKAEADTREADAPIDLDAREASADVLDAPDSEEVPMRDGSSLDPNLLPTGAPSDRIFLYWLLDEGAGSTAYDASGHGRDGTLLKNPTWKPDHAPTTRANDTYSLYFDGNSNSVACIDPSGPVVSYTVSLWVRPNSYSAGEQLLIFQRRDAVGSAKFMQIRISSGGHFEHFINDDSGSDNCPEGKGSCVTAKTSVGSNKWYHLAATADNGGLMRLFVNGLEETAGRTIGTMQGKGDRYELSDVEGMMVNAFKGLIDEVIVYERALSPEEIGALAAQPRPDGGT